MTSPRRVALPVAALLTAATLIAPAAAVAPAADEEIAFGTSEAGAPDVGPGRYQFTMPKTEEEEYVVVNRTMDKSTLWVAETLFSSKTKNGYVYFDPTGVDTKNRCGDLSGQLEGDDYVGHQYMTGVIFLGKGPCQDEKSVLLDVRGYTAGSGGNDDYPTGEKGQLVVWEEPPVEDASLLPPPSTTVKWDGEVQPAQGKTELGTTYAEAPELDKGRWEVHVDPGKPALFAVPLDWGQHVELQLQYKGAEYKSYVPIEPELITPLGGKADWAKADGGPTFPDVNLKYPSMDGGVVSPTITWRNRESPADNPAAFPGTYYVLLKMGTKDAPAKGADLTLGVNVITDKESKAPYAEEADPVPDISGKTEPGDDEKESGGGGGSDEEASGGSGGSTPWGGVIALFGGAAVMAAAGAVSLGRYRKQLA